jgi:hypothetical protein
VVFSLALSVAGWVIQHRLVGQAQTRLRELREIERDLRDAERELAVLRMRQTSLVEIARLVDLGERETWPAPDPADPTIRGRADVVRDRLDLVARHEEIFGRLDAVESLLASVAMVVDRVFLRGLGITPTALVNPHSLSSNEGALWTRFSRHSSRDPSRSVRSSIVQYNEDGPRLTCSCWWSIRETTASR